MNATPPPKGAQAALRAVRLLKFFTDERPELTLAELSRTSGLNKTTTHRLIRALQSEGMVERNLSTGAYCLGAGLMALGVQALASNHLRRRVRPLLRSLAKESGEIATLEVPVEDRMLVLDEIAATQVAGTVANVGTCWPIHATSTGKVWLAFDETGIDRLSGRLKPLAANTVTRRDAIQAQFSEIRRRGYAVAIDELEDGFTEVATVIRGSQGDVQAALSIGGPSQRLTSSRQAELGNLLCRAAARINPPS